MDGILVPVAVAVFFVIRAISAVRSSQRQPRPTSGAPPRPARAPRASTPGRRGPSTLEELLAEMQAESQAGAPRRLPPIMAPAPVEPAPTTSRTKGVTRESLEDQPVEAVSMELELSHDAQAEQIALARRAAVERLNTLAASGLPAPMRPVSPAVAVPAAPSRPPRAAQRLRGGAREGMIWREILDVPVSLRKPSRP